MDSGVEWGGQGHVNPPPLGDFFSRSTSKICLANLTLRPCAGGQGPGPGQPGQRREAEDNHADISGPGILLLELVQA